MNTHLTPEFEVLNFGFKVAHVGDLRAVFSEDKGQIHKRMIIPHYRKLLQSPLNLSRAYKQQPS